MKNSEQLKLLMKISRLYYLENKNQNEISDRLNISRTKVSRYLSKAKKEKIVEIKINSPRERFDELEDRIEKLFNLKECIIVPSDDDKREVYLNMASSLAGLLDRILKEGELLGVGWGNTLKSVASFIEPERRINIKVIPLLGGLGKTGIEIHTNSVAKTLADKYGGQSFVIHSPAVVDSEEAKEVLMKDSSVSEIFEMFDGISTAIIGMSDIGQDSTMIKTGNFKQNDFKYLSGLGVAGDINLIFIDNEGNPIKSELDDRIVRAPLEKIKRIKNVIGVSFGLNKTGVITGALKGKIINILITDESTANEILKN